MTENQTAVLAERRTRWQTAIYWMRRAVMLEIWGYVSIYRYVCRRPKVPRGAEAFSYHQPVVLVLAVIIGVSALELVVVDLLTRRWPSVRISMLILGIWGLVWVFGLLFGMLTRPHAVGPAEIRLRSGAEFDQPLAWHQVETVSRRKRASQEKRPQVTRDDLGDCTLHLDMQNETNVQIALREPVRVRLARGPVTVSRIELYVDDPEAFVNATKKYQDRQPG